MMVVVLKIHRIIEFVQDQIVEKNFFDVDKMMGIDHLMKKIKMIRVVLLEDYLYYL
jgi:hypothetical protein